MGSSNLVVTNTHLLAKGIGFGLEQCFSTRRDIFVLLFVFCFCPHRGHLTMFRDMFQTFLVIKTGGEEAGTGI